MVEDHLPHLSFRKIAAASRDAFGAERAPCHTAVWEHWRRLNAGRRRLRQSNLAHDPEVRTLVDALLPHLTYKEIEAICHERFGARRAPSKATIGNRSRRLFGPRRRHILSRDREVRELLDVLAGRYTARRASDIVREHYGDKRAPSPSAIWSYWWRSGRTIARRHRRLRPDGTQ